MILSAFLAPFRSGAEACAEEVALRLSDQFDIMIVTARLRKDLPRHDMLRGKVPVVRVGLGLPIDKWLFPLLAPFAVRSCVGAPRWGARERIMLPQGSPPHFTNSRRQGYDRQEATSGRAASPYEPLIIHAILETFAGLALLFCRLLIPSAKRILTLQTLNRSLLKSPIIRAAHKVTAISTPLQKIAEDCGANNVALIPNGIDLDRVVAFQKVSGRILFVGRLEPMKGVDTLLHAFAKVRGDGIHLRIVGDGSQRQKLESLALELGITDRVTFVGYVPVEHVYEEFAKAEIFCGLSRSEALGNVFLEAQASGCAVIGTNVGGIPDIVKHGETGLLVSPDDVDAAAQAMQSLIEDPLLRERLSTNTSFVMYDWRTISRQYANVYYSVE